MRRKVSEAHSEVIHYTSASGLAGIVASQTLWATHSAFLNDVSEIALFFDRRLAAILESGIRAELAESPDLQVLPEFARTSEEANQAIGRYAMDMARTFRTISHRFNQPYFFSFCAPANARTGRDGLLSQWRGYGKDGGYALVFDTKQLEELQKAEASAFWYQHMQWGNVHYHQDDDDLSRAEPEILESEDSLRGAIRAFVRQPGSDALESTFEPVATLSCLYKHWGFHEEREVRIVAIPPNTELIRDGRTEGEARPVRMPKHLLRGGTPVPYIELFASAAGDAHQRRLPITRVLVGPHPQSHLRKRAVETMLESKGIAVEVVVSQIPYVGSW